MEMFGKILLGLGVAWMVLLYGIQAAGYLMAIYLGGWNQILNYEGESLLFLVVWSLPGVALILAGSKLADLD